MITNKTEFIDYCLRALGFPVVEINIDDDQITDRITEALDLYYDAHHSSTEQIYYIHTVDQSTIDDRKFTVPDTIMSVSRFITTNSTYNLNVLGGNSSIAFDSNLNSALFGSYMGSGGSSSVIGDVGGGSNRSSLSDYFIRLKALEEFQDLLNSDVRYTFNQNTHEVKFYSNPQLGDEMVMECYVELDPETYTSIYNDRWLKLYTTQLIKRQWGTNLKKYAGFQLPSGITLDGQTIYNEANEEIEKLENEIRRDYQEPMGFIFD